MSTLDQILQNNSLVWTIVGILASITFFGAIIWLIIASRKPPEDRLVENIIMELSQDYMRDVVLSDGLYGYYFIDYLILLPGRIVMLGLEHLDGYIFGSEHVEQWAQVLNKKSKNFPNPLLSLDLYLQSIQTILPGIQLVGRVVFTSQCEFPKGTPKGVIRLDCLHRELEKLQDGTNTDKNIQYFWDQLIEITKHDKQRYIQEDKVA